MVEEIMEQAPAQHAGAAVLPGPDAGRRQLSAPELHGGSDASASDLMRHGRRMEVLSLAYKWDDPSNMYLAAPC